MLQSFTPLPDKKQATRNNLIDAAYQLFSRQGFNQATTKAIAEHAGVSELTLFRHFKNKVNLLEQVLAKYSVAVKLEQLESELNRLDFESGFRFFAAALLQEFEARYPMFRLMIIEATSNPELKSAIGPLPVKLRGLLVNHLKKGVRQGLVQPGLNLELTAQSFLWIFMSYVMTRSDVGQKFFPFAPEEVVTAATDIFLQGIRPESVEMRTNEAN